MILVVSPDHATALLTYLVRKRLPRTVASRRFSRCEGCRFLESATLVDDDDKTPFSAGDERAAVRLEFVKLTLRKLGGAFSNDLGFNPVVDVWHVVVMLFGDFGKLGLVRVAQLAAYHGLFLDADRQ